MLQAELKSKLPTDYYNKEDLLTSVFFGSIELTEMYDIFFELIFKSRNINGEIFSDFIKNRFDINLNIFPGMGISFWEKIKNNEPDLIIKLNTQSSLFKIIMEIKLYSGKSGFEENDQLVRYINLNLNNYEKTPVIYLTENKKYEDIFSSISIDKSTKDFVFLITWKEIYDYLKSKKTTKLYQELSLILEKRNLIHFSGFYKNISEVIDIEKLRGNKND